MILNHKEVDPDANALPKLEEQIQEKEREKVLNAKITDLKRMTEYIRQVLQLSLRGTWKINYVIQLQDKLVNYDLTQLFITILKRNM